jgi:RNA-splicing ligase RtcB
MYTDMTDWGFKAPTRMWTDPSEVEAQAIQQLRNIAALPWVHGVAVMPDVHLGKGATVGSVIAMKQAGTVAVGGRCRYRLWHGGGEDVHHGVAVARCPLCDAP